ncbi:MAG TPA: tetratricopeptide repeat protein [Acetobacteraceae bacterium]|nr:tetratricopeptide repeat protein [Acetobacteraceae bacterium]
MHTSDATDPAVTIELAEASFARRDLLSARTHYESALTRLRCNGVDDPAMVRALVGLAWTMQGLDDADMALRLHEQALDMQQRIAPDAQAAICIIRRGIAAAQTALGLLEPALEQNRKVLAAQRALLDGADPDLAETLNIMGETAARLERYAEARQYQEEALAILRQVHPAGAPEIAAALTNLGVSLYRLEAPAEAETCLREALAIDPELLLAAENLIHVLYQQGRKAEGRALAAEKYRRRSFVVQPAPPRPTGTLLVLWSLDGNIPKQHLLARLPLTVIDWHIQYASPDHERQLPPFDLVFNLIGDADHGAVALAAARAFRQRCDVTLLNDPVKVQRTRRDMIPELLAGIDGLVIPRIVRLSSAMLRDAGRARVIADAGVSMPLLLRNAGMHGGESVQRIFDDTGLAQAAIESGDDDMFYVTAYHDYASADGFYRKYRAVFVDRVPFPYHLAISSDWLVHYFSADMAAHPWKLAEERRYLEDAQGVLGARGWAVLEEIARRMDLDYCGVDFTLLPDGRVLLFEANATMLVHPEEDGMLAHKNVHVARILAAFDELVRRNLPLGKRWPPAEAGRAIVS